MSDKITTFPVLAPLNTASDGSIFSPSGQGGDAGNTSVSTGFSSQFQGDLYCSRGRLGNGTAYVDISAQDMHSSNFVTGVSGWQLKYNGDIELNTGVFRGDITAANIDLTGGTLRYQKTSFTDTANSGYYISSEGIYFGSASDLTKLKFNIFTGVLDYIGTLSNQAGQIVIDASAQTILKDFTFGATDYSGAFKSGDIAWNTTTGALTGGSGIIMYRKGIVGATAGVATFTIDATTGAATFAGNLSAAGGTFSGTLTVGTALDIAVQSDFPPDTNLVGYWSFDESAGTNAADSSGNGYEGTITGATFGQGVSGNCLDFANATDNINLDDITELNGTAHFSFSCWAKQDTLDTYNIIFEKYSGATSEIGFTTYTDGKFYFAIRNGNGSSTGSFDYSTAVTAGVWFFLRVEYDGTQSTNATKLKVFINEVQQTLTFGADIPATTADLTGINAYIGWTSNSWRGNIDEVRLYSTNLTDKQGYAFYKNPQGGKSFNVPIGSLIAGTIYSKQINLSFIEGMGDCFIAGGKTDFGQDSTTGFIIGIDDSDSNLAKFEITNGRITSGLIQTAATGNQRIALSSSEDAKVLNWKDTNNINRAYVKFDFTNSILRLYAYDGDATSAEYEFDYLNGFYPGTDDTLLGRSDHRWFLYSSGISCDGNFNLHQEPVAVEITPDKYFIIYLHGIAYKVPCLAA